MPPPRVYITVSRSGQILSPCIHRSSAVLATTVTSSPHPGTPRRPWRKRAPPTPPESTVTRRAGGVGEPSGTPAWGVVMGALYRPAPTGVKPDGPSRVAPEHVGPGSALRPAWFGPEGRRRTIPPGSE